MGAFFERREFPDLVETCRTDPFPKAAGKSRIATIEAAWEMEDKVAEAHEKLTFHRANLLIVGPPGSGKSAVLTQVIKMATNQANNGRS